MAKKRSDCLIVIPLLQIHLLIGFGKFCTSISWKKRVRKFPFNLPGKSQVTAPAPAAFHVASFLLNQKGSSTQWMATCRCKLGDYSHPHSTYSLKTTFTDILVHRDAMNNRLDCLLFSFMFLFSRYDPACLDEMNASVSSQNVTGFIPRSML